MSTRALPWLSIDAAAVLADDDAVAERDGRLVRAALDDPDAYRHLVALHQGKVFATALRLTGSEADAADVSQEAFLRAYKALGRFQQGRRFAPWVCTIAANAARDMLRDPIRRFLRFGFGHREEEARERTAQPLEADERRDALARDLLLLKPKLREAIVLRYVSELSVEEVADALGIGVSAAKMRIKRGLEQLESLGR